MDLHIEKIVADTDSDTNADKIQLNGKRKKIVDLLEIKKATANKINLTKAIYEKIFYAHKDDQTKLTDNKVDAKDYVSPIIAQNAKFILKKETDLAPKLSFGDSWTIKDVDTFLRTFELGTTAYDETKWKVTFVADATTFGDSLYKLVYTEASEEKKYLLLQEIN